MILDPGQILHHPGRVCEDPFVDPLQDMTPAIGQGRQQGIVDVSRAERCERSAVETPTGFENG
jgi:hypothetical protein